MVLKEFLTPRKKSRGSEPNLVFDQPLLCRSAQLEGQERERAWLASGQHIVLLLMLLYVFLRIEHVIACVSPLSCAVLLLMNASSTITLAETAAR